MQVSGYRTGTITGAPNEMWIKLRNTNFGESTIGAGYIGQDSGGNLNLAATRRSDTSGAIRFFVNESGGETQVMGIYGTGNVGIGTTTPNYKLDVKGDVNAYNLKINGTAVGSGNITGEGTANYIAKFTAAGTIGNSNIYDDGNTIVITLG